MVAESLPGLDCAKIGDTPQIAEINSTLTHNLTVKNLIKRKLKNNVIINFLKRI